MVDEHIVEHLSATAEPNAKCWFFSLLETLPHDEFVKVLVTLWAIWKGLGEKLFMRENSESSVYYFFHPKLPR